MIKTTTQKIDELTKQYFNEYYLYKTDEVNDHHIIVVLLDGSNASLKDIDSYAQTLLKIDGLDCQDLSLSTRTLNVRVW